MSDKPSGIQGRGIFRRSQAREAARNVPTETNETETPLPTAESAAPEQTTPSPAESQPEYEVTDNVADPIVADESFTVTATPPEDDDLTERLAAQAALAVGNSDAVSVDPAAAPEADLEMAEDSLPNSTAEEAAFFNFDDSDVSEVVDAPTPETVIDQASPGRPNREPDIAIDPPFPDALPAEDTSEMPAFSTPARPAPGSTEPEVEFADDLGIPPSPYSTATSDAVEPVAADEADFNFAFNAGEAPAEPPNPFTSLVERSTGGAMILPDALADLTPSERKQRLRLLSDERLQQKYDEIFEAIDTQYKAILDSKLSTNADLTNRLHLLLSEARYILVNYDLDQLYKAEMNIAEVKTTLERARESNESKKTWSAFIVSWALLWFFVFTYFIFNPYPLLNALDLGSVGGILIPDILLRAMLFGGVGGVSAVFYSLLKYISARNYDAEHNIRYFIKPFSGLVVGIIVYLVALVIMGFFNVIPPDGQLMAENTSNTAVAIVVLAWIIALGAGFKENLTFARLDAVMGRFFNRNNQGGA